MAADASMFVLPASPNWYCSNIADCSLNKVYVFGARNYLYLLNVGSQTPSFEGQLTGHAERVTSVCFSKHKVQANFVASGSDDKTVKIWDTETKLMLLEHKAHSVRMLWQCPLDPPWAEQGVISHFSKNFHTLAANPRAPLTMSFLPPKISKRAHIRIVNFPF